MTVDSVAFVGMRSDRFAETVRLFRDVIGFGVGDFDAARAAMLAAEVEFTGSIQHADGVSWQHFRCPDDTVAEITGPGKAPARF